MSCESFPSYPPDFEVNFWHPQLRKVGKGAAKRRWDALGREDQWRAVRAWAEQRPYYLRRKEVRDQDYPHPETWLSQRRWEDEVDLADFNPEPPSYTDRHGVSSRPPEIFSAEDWERNRPPPEEREKAATLAKNFLKRLGKRSQPDTPECDNGLDETQAPPGRANTERDTETQ